MRHLISLKEQGPSELREILDLALRMKSDGRDAWEDALRQKSLIMLFQKTSTRTRLSFEIAMTELGGHAVFLDQRTTNLALADFRDEIRVILGMGDALMFRALEAADVELAASMNIAPVIDACSEKYHPCQALGDILTMAEDAGGIEKIGKIVWLGIENNVSNTLLCAAAKLGIEIVCVSPERDPASLDEELLRQAEMTGKVRRTLDLREALDGARYVHTDTWTNMEFFGPDGKVRDGFGQEYERRKQIFGPYQLSQEMLDQYGAQAKIMHCMPCHVGYEITRSAIDSPGSLIFPQALNRKHVQKAILVWLLGRVA